MSTLTARKPMKRTGFKRKQPVSIYKTAALGPSMTLIEKREVEREKRLADIAKSAIENALEKPANVALVSLSAPTAQVKKENPLRSEAYRRAVASLPCIHCGIEGYSQHAHENAGKGKGMKADDRCAMPLCCTRPGIEGCHAAFDGYHLLPGGREAHHAQGRAWAKQTRNQVYESGQWPVNLPMWRE